MGEAIPVLDLTKDSVAPEARAVEKRIALLLLGWSTSLAVATTVELMK